MVVLPKTLKKSSRCCMPHTMIERPLGFERSSTLSLPFSHCPERDHRPEISKRLHPNHHPVRAQNLSVLLPIPTNFFGSHQQDNASGVCVIIRSCSMRSIRPQAMPATRLWFQIFQRLLQIRSDGEQEVRRWYAKALREKTIHAKLDVYFMGGSHPLRRGGNRADAMLNPSSASRRQTQPN